MPRYKYTFYTFYNEVKKSYSKSIAKVSTEVSNEKILNTLIQLIY
jgi:hypothetical protein